MSSPTWKCVKWSKMRDPAVVNRLYAETFAKYHALPPRSQHRPAVWKRLRYLKTEQLMIALREERIGSRARQPKSALGLGAGEHERIEQSTAAPSPQACGQEQNKPRRADKPSPGGATKRRAA